MPARPPTQLRRRAAPAPAPKPEQVRRRAAAKPDAAAGSAAAPRLQAKLAVSRPGDASEQEADRVAAEVRRAARPGAAATPAPPAERSVQRASLAPGARAGDEAETLARAVVPEARALRPAAPQPPEVRRAPEDGAAAGGEPVADETERGIDARRGTGEPLPEAVLAEMEARFGRSFAAVRVHADAAAADLCARTAARAFTVGHDIFFAPGELAPDTDAGRELLAHELAHVVQQDGAAAGIARKVTPQLEPEFRPTPATAAKLKELSTLELPSVKARHLVLYAGLAKAGKLKRLRGYDRERPAQKEVWKSKAKVSEEAVKERLAERKIPIPKKASDPVKFQVKGGKKTHRVSEPLAALRERLQVPEWDRQGGEQNFQVDHVVELQISGAYGEGVGNSLENMELLDQPSNSSSGGGIKAAIYERVQAYLDTFKPPMDRKKFLEKHDVGFDVVKAAGGDAAAHESAWWSKAEIEAAEPLRVAEPPGSAGGAAAAAAAADGTATDFVLSSGPEGVAVGHLKREAGEQAFEVDEGDPQARCLTGLVIHEVKAPGGAGKAGSLAADWDLPDKWEPDPKKVAVELEGEGEHRAFAAGIPKLKLDFEYLSPVEFDRVSVEDGELWADGKLTPSIDLLGAPIDVRLRGRDLTFGLVYSAGEVRLPIPGVSIDDASVGVFYSTQRGFGIEGLVLYSVPRVGSGSLLAGFTPAEGVFLAGDFAFDRRLFDRAAVKVWWKKGALGAEGVLGIEKPDRIRGVRSAAIRVGLADGKWQLTGSAVLSVPGVRDATLSVRQTEAGLLVEGDAVLAPSAAIRSGALHVSCAEGPDGWKLSASGTAEPAIPGLASQLAVTYDDGAFLAEFDGAFQRGLLSGTLRAGATNRALDAEGRPTGAALPGAPLVIYGAGIATLQLAPWLQGTAGIRLAPSGELTVSGEVGLPAALQIFPRKQVDRPLFAMAAQLPVAPGIVAEVGGNLSAHASIGPGSLDQLRLGVEYTPAHEDRTHVVGDAHLTVPADAGLRLGARAGIGLGIPGASATGGLEVGGTLGVAGAAEAGVHVDWLPSRGLAVDAEGALHAEPRFRLDLSGYVSVTAAGFSLYDERFELAAVELGSNLRFGVRFPIRYREGEPFDVRLDDVEFETPHVDVMELVGELAARATGEPLPEPGAAAASGRGPAPARPETVSRPDAARGEAPRPGEAARPAPGPPKRRPE